MDVWLNRSAPSRTFPQYRPPSASCSQTSGKNESVGPSTSGAWISIARPRNAAQYLGRDDRARAATWTPSRVPQRALREDEPLRGREIEKIERQALGLGKVVRRSDDGRAVGVDEVADDARRRVARGDDADGSSGNEHAIQDRRQRVLVEILIMM